MTRRIFKKRGNRIKHYIHYFIFFVIFLLFLPGMIDVFKKSVFAYREEAVYREKLEDVLSQNEQIEMQIAKINNSFEREKLLRSRGLYRKENEGIINIYEKDDLVSQQPYEYFNKNDSVFFEVNF